MSAAIWIKNPLINLIGFSFCTTICPVKKKGSRFIMKNVQNNNISCDWMRGYVAGITAYEDYLLDELIAYGILNAHPNQKKSEYLSFELYEE